jgi:hypothetical protein
MLTLRTLFDLSKPIVSEILRDKQKLDTFTNIGKKGNRFFALSSSRDESGRSKHYLLHPWPPSVWAVPDPR